jgi:hypothetical protein
MASARASQQTPNGGGYTGGGPSSGAGRARVDVTCDGTPPLMAGGGGSEGGHGAAGWRGSGADADALVQMERRLARLEALLQRMNASMDSQRAAQATRGVAPGAPTAAFSAAPLPQPSNGGVGRAAAALTPPASNPLTAAEAAAQAAFPTERL